MTSILLQSIDQFELSFQECGGGTFLIRDGQIINSKRLANAIATSGSSVRRAEEDCNRVFAVADFFDVYLPEVRYSDEDLVQFATVFAARLRAQLRAKLPSKRYEVEIVGEHLIDEEPLELCVTFRTLE